MLITAAGSGGGASFFLRAVGGKKSPGSQKVIVKIAGPLKKKFPRPFRSPLPHCLDHCSV